MALEGLLNTLQIGGIIPNNAPSSHAINSATAREIHLGIEAQVIRLGIEDPAIHPEIEAQARAEVATKA
jgi:hypothetical protein